MFEDDWAALAEHAAEQTMVAAVRSAVRDFQGFATSHRLTDDCALCLARPSAPYQGQLSLPDIVVNAEDEDDEQEDGGGGGDDDDNDSDPDDPTRPLSRASDHDSRGGSPRRSPHLRGPGQPGRRLGRAAAGHAVVHRAVQSSSDLPSVNTNRRQPDNRRSATMMPHGAAQRTHYGSAPPDRGSDCLTEPAAQFTPHGTPQAASASRQSPSRRRRLRRTAQSRCGRRVWRCRRCRCRWAPSAPRAPRRRTRTTCICQPRRSRTCRGPLGRPAAPSRCAAPWRCATRRAPRRK